MKYKFHNLNVYLIISPLFKFPEFQKWEEHMYL